MNHETESGVTLKTESGTKAAIFFNTPAEFREWLKANHDSAREIWVGLYKSKFPTKGITYSEALDEALCYGWIDGALRSFDKETWTKRFTPRKPGSIWSRVNVRHVERLMKLGLMQPAGLKAFGERRADKTGIYSYEQDAANFSKEYEKKFKSNKGGWIFFNKQAASYRKTATHWVMRAKKEETRMKRLDELIEESGQGMRLAQFTYQLWKERKSGK